MRASARAGRFAIHGPIQRSDLAGLGRRVCALLERSRAQVMLCDVTGVEADAVCVDALARLALAGQRRGCLIRLQGVSPDLEALVALMGLEQVLLDESSRGDRLDCGQAGPEPGRPEPGCAGERGSAV